MLKDGFPKVAMALISIITLWVLGSIVTRIILGQNYPNSTFANDIKINLGLVFFFILSSGFLFTYVYKVYFRPPSNLTNIALSAILFAIHAGLYIVLFLRLPMSQSFGLVAAGASCVAGVEFLIYVAVYRGKRKSTDF